MIKKEVTFHDFEGETHTREYYFHLSKIDISQFELSFPGGLEVHMKKLVAEGRVSEIFETIRKTVLLSYGEKSDDGMSFRKVKNGQPLYEEFAGTPAFETLMLELMELDEENGTAPALTAFIQGIMPKEL